MDKRTKVTIIVPVYNGEKTLSLCLDSLMALNYPRDCLEIIIVDNNSNDRTKEIAKQYPIRYIFEKKGSIPAARNKGIKFSNSELIAFIDADCIADKNWIKHLVEPLRDKNIGAVGGKILSYRPQNLIEKYIDYDNSCYCQCGQVEGQKYALPWVTTANAAFRKDILKEIGLFDTAFSRHSDDDLTTRIVLAGYNIRYSPASLVFHKNRDRLTDFYMWHFRKGLAFPVLLAKYKGVLKINSKDCFLQVILQKVSTTKQNVQKFIKSLFIKRNITETTFSLLDITKNIAYLGGYIFGWLKIVLGFEKVSLENVNTNNGLLYWNEGNGSVILDLKQTPSRYYHLDEIGKKIWELSNIHNKSEEEILNILAEEYEEEKENIKADLQELMSGLKEISILNAENT